ncbi:MAG TPA: nucleotide exchange factor GrpE [Candidatus Paceibacterota bacterium]|nr:nucleotide exchange factor GrpE [Verrucomicrobiota bacterium]HRZ47424.1 nucleotide exchange factor GrpE [Candidatus Paceibacterota bacterium]HRZ92450.1 nucleotide exchange factor GrpE [Candidatus Paceibacterota bacterium]
MKMKERVKSIWDAITGRTATSAESQQATASEQGSALARLRMDLESSRAEAAKLREEYVRHEQEAAAARQAAAGEAVSGLLRALAPTLSQLATLRHMAEAGREVRAADALKLCGRIEQTLAEHGLERIGEVGAEAAFDPALHQRMSGGDVRDGDPVRVRFVGYRFRGETPVKAMVSRVGSEPGKE